MRHWYAVLTKPRSEYQALAQLQRQGYEAWLPLLKQGKRGATKDSVVPLFPRYLFTHVDVETQDISPIRSTVGCCGVVRFGTKPAPVPAAVVEQLKARVDAAGCIQLVKPTPRWEPGQVLRIVEGPFQGLCALYQARTAQQRVLLLLDWMGTQCRVAVPADALEALPAV